MKLIRENISSVDAAALTRWLRDPACDTFLRVMESEAFCAEAMAAENFMKRTPAADDAARDQVQNAAKIRYILDLMTKYRAAKTFETARAIPTRFSA